MAAALVHAEGCFLALARDAHNACHCAYTGRATDLSTGVGLRRTAGATSQGARLGAPLRTGLRGSGLRGDRRRHDRREIVVGDRVFVFLAEEPLFNEKIDAWGKDAWAAFSLEQPNGARVLLASKDKLGFFFTARRLLPHGHGHRHYDGHDAHADQKDGHRVALLAASVAAHLTT